MTSGHNTRSRALARADENDGSNNNDPTEPLQGSPEREERQNTQGNHDEQQTFADGEPPEGAHEEQQTQADDMPFEGVREEQRTMDLDQRPLTQPVPPPPPPPPAPQNGVRSNESENESAGNQANGGATTVSATTVSTMVDTMNCMMQELVKNSAKNNARETICIRPAATAPSKLSLKQARSSTLMATWSAEAMAYLEASQLYESAPDYFNLLTTEVKNQIRFHYEHMKPDKPKASDLHALIVKLLQEDRGIEAFSNLCKAQQLPNENIGTYATRLQTYSRELANSQNPWIRALECQQLVKLRLLLFNNLPLTDYFLDQHPDLDDYVLIQIIDDLRFIEQQQPRSVTTNPVFQLNSANAPRKNTSGTVLFRNLPGAKKKAIREFQWKYYQDPELKELKLFFDGQKNAELERKCSELDLHWPTLRYPAKSNKNKQMSWLELQAIAANVRNAANQYQQNRVSQQS